MRGISLRHHLSAIAALAMVVTACAPTTTQPTPTAATAAPAATPAPPRGGSFTFAIWQEPATLYPFHGTQTVISVVLNPVYEGMVNVDTNGDFVADLAKKVPTIQNGGVKLTEDGKKMEVTYDLLDGVKWADGQPFTSADVKFTWEAIMKDPKVTSREGYDKIEAIDTPSPTSVVVKYKEIYAPYATRFSQIIPKHAFEKDIADPSKSPFARTPIGTGPFKVTEFRTADSIIVERNTNYRDKDRPLLDKIVFRSVPSREVAIAQLKAGEVDGMWNLLEAQVPELERETSIKLATIESPTVERLEFNLAKPANPADPKVAHPVLGDIAVRKALLLATPKKAIVDKLLAGKAKPGTSPISQGWAAPRDLKQDDYDPNKAKQTLDQAGWKPGADGIRAKDGVRASLVITTTTGDKTREQVEQILIDEYKAIGVELKIKNLPSATLFGSWAANAPRKKGDFDINMYASTPDVDPHSTINLRFHSTNIPRPENNGAGFNYNRFSDPQVDKWIAEAGSIADQDKRKQLYRQVLQRVNDQVLNVWLYDRANIDAFRANVAGYKQNVWDEVTATARDWFVRR